MADEKSFDCVRFMREARARVSRELSGKTPEERARWINEEGAKFWNQNPAPAPADARKSA